MFPFVVSGYVKKPPVILGKEQTDWLRFFSVIQDLVTHGLEDYWKRQQEFAQVANILTIVVFTG